MPVELRAPRSNGLARYSVGVSACVSTVIARGAAFLFAAASGSDSPSVIVRIRNLRMRPDGNKKIRIARGGGQAPPPVRTGEGAETGEGACPPLLIHDLLKRRIVPQSIQ